MDFDFSDDQQQLRDAVRKWVDKGYSFERRRAIVAAGGFDRAAYGELAELGLTALTVPEQHDGMGQSAIDAWVVWDPFLAAVQTQAAVRVLADGRDS